MTNLDLIAAIGAASGRDLEHSEAPRSVKRCSMTARLLIAAAVIALLSTTVFAVPAIRSAIFGAKIRPVCISRIYVKDGKLADVTEGWADVSLDVDLDPDAPEVIETYYVPLLPAEQWTVTPLTVTEGSTVSFQSGTLLQWEKEDGAFIRFRQEACPDCTEDYPVDSVCTGFEAVYTVSEATLGGYPVQRIIVAPSEKEKDGFRAAHPGLQKLYWSDGFYLFSMEVNYSMPDDELAAILKSIRPVEDVADYVVIRRVPAQITPQPTLNLERVMFPETLPEGYVRIGGQYRQPNGGFLFAWLKETPYFANLALEIEPELCEDARMLWETHYIADKTAEWEVNGASVTGWQNASRAQIVWRCDGADYSLKSFGEEGHRLSMEELLEIMEELVPITDIDSYLKD